MQCYTYIFLYIHLYELFPTRCLLIIQRSVCLPRLSGRRGVVIACVCPYVSSVCLSVRLFCLFACPSVHLSVNFWILTRSSRSFGHFNSEFLETAFKLLLCNGSSPAKGCYTPQRAIVFIKKWLKRVRVWVTIHVRANVRNYTTRHCRVGCSVPAF